LSELVIGVRRLTAVNGHTHDSDARGERGQPLPLLSRSQL
jgi:hypothetical protein